MNGLWQAILTAFFIQFDFHLDFVQIVWNKIGYQAMYVNAFSRFSNGLNPNGFNGNGPVLFNSQEDCRYYFCVDCVQIIKKSLIWDVTVNILSMEHSCKWTEQFNKCTWTVKVTTSLLLTRPSTRLPFSSYPLSFFLVSPFLFLFFTCHSLRVVFTHITISLLLVSDF